MIEKTDFYVYVYFRLDGSPCYVGKGRGERWLVHERQESHNQHFNRIISKAGASLPKVKTREGLTNAAAIETEIALIAAIGRADLGSGPLVNHTIGGDGSRGHIHTMSASSRRKLSAAKMGHAVSKETREKISRALRGRSLSSEHKEKVSAGIKASGKAAAHILDLANQCRGKRLSQEHCEKVRLANIGKNRSPEARAAMSEAQRRRKHGPMSPEALARRREKTKHHTKSPETRARISAAAKAQHARARAERERDRPTLL